MRISRLVLGIGAALALLGQGALALARPCLCATAPTSTTACCCGPADDAPKAAERACCSPAEGGVPRSATEGAASEGCGDEGGRCAREVLGDLSAAASFSAPAAAVLAGLEPFPGFMPLAVDPPQADARVSRPCESPPPPLLALRVARTTVLRI